MSQVFEAPDTKDASKLLYRAVHCAKCGAVVGTVEPQQLSKSLDNARAEIGGLSKRVEDLERAVQALVKRLPPVLTEGE